MRLKPIVKIDDMELIENEYNDGVNIYNVLKLIEHSKKFEVFDLPVAGIDISKSPWGDQNIKGMAYHYKRMQNASFKHPILLDPDGYTCDGWHRILKALIKGRRTIKAIRMDTMPKPDRPSESNE